MDDDLQSLFAQLEAAQEKKSSVRLSDRVVVELVVKLRDLGLFGDELLHTINGREYITKEQVKRDVQRALDDAGGRIAVVDLPSLLGVDLVHCQTQADALIKESGGSVVEVQGDLIAASYFDNLAAEVEEMLCDAGALEMGDLAKQFGLGTEQVTVHVKKHLGGTIKGTLDANMLYTDAFVARVKSSLRGALRASLTPVSVAGLLRTVKLPLPGPSASKLVSRLIDELVADGSVLGSYKGGSTSTFTPAVYQRAQADAVAAFYTQNGYVEYETLTRLGVSGPKAFLRAAFPDGIALEGAFVSPSITAQVDAAVEEQATSGGWFDAAGLLPSVLSPADVGKLLQGASAMGKATSAGSRVLSATCLVSKQSLDSWQAAADEAAREAADKAVQARQAKPPPAVAAPAAAKKGGQDKKASAQDDDDWDTGPSKKGKKGKAGKGKAPAGAAASAKQSESADPGCPTLASLTEWVVAREPELEGCGVDGELAGAVAQELLRGAVDQYQQAVQAAFSKDVQDGRRLLEAAQTAAVEAVFKLALYARGLDALAPAASDDEAAADAEAPKARETLDRHLVRSSGCVAADAVLQLLRLSGADPGDEASTSGGTASGGQPPLSVAERRAIADKLPADLAPSALTLVKALDSSSTTAASLIACLESALDAVGVRARKLDKKVEKAAVAAERQAMLLKLQAPGITPADALAIAIPCLVAKQRSKLVNVPGRSISFVLDILKADLADADYELVSTFHKLVLQQLTALSRAGDPTESGPVAERLEELQECLPKLLKMC